MINALASDSMTVLAKNMKPVRLSAVWASQSGYKYKTGLTFNLRLDKVKHLAEAVLERKGLDSHGLQLLTLLVVEVLQLIHAEHPVPIQVHTAKPVLYTGQRVRKREVIRGACKKDIKDIKKCLNLTFSLECKQNYQCFFGGARIKETMV